MIQKKIANDYGTAGRILAFLKHKYMLCTVQIAGQIVL